jgi:hypothetical protein
MFLKGQCHKIFASAFFMNHLPPSPRNNIRVISNFIKNLRRYLQVPPLSRATGVNDTCSKFAASVIDTGGAPSLANISTNFRKKSKWPKFATSVKDKSGKLLPVSTTLWANNGDKIRLLTSEKFIYMLILLHKGVPKKWLKFFWLKIFFICHLCQLHRWCRRAVNISANFRKNFKQPYWYTQGIGGN